MMRLIGVSSTQSRVSLFFVNGRALPTLKPIFSSLLAARTIAFSSRPLSVCSICRIIRHNKHDNNKSEICSTHHKAAAIPSPMRKCCGGNMRIFSTCTTNTISSAAPLIVHSSSSLVLSAHLISADVPQRSEEWFALRKDKLTTSTFGTALGFWKGNRRVELWHEKVFASETNIAEASKNAMQWGVLNEEAAIYRYKSITGREVISLGFAVHANEQFHWLGASPDGVLDCFPEGGILEVKCPYNKGKPELGLPWAKMPYYYMPQVQGQMEIMDRDWVDLYCWTLNGSTLFRVHRDRGYWEFIHGILKEFWWESVVPAKEALLLGKEEEAKVFKPTTTHNLTGLAISRSLKLASEAMLLCREISGHVEFYGT